MSYLKAAFLSETNAEQPHQPVVGALYPLSATSDAHRRMEAGGVFGKIVLGDFHE